MHPVWLILDTACPRGLIALVRGREILSEVYLDEYRKHGERLPGAVQACLNKANLKISDINSVFVGRGPGSFIGVRVAMAYSKGLCAALNVPLMGFDTLAAIEKPEGVEYTAIDARRGEFYVFKSKTSILKDLPENTHLEVEGPSVIGALKLLPETIENQLLELTPNYLRAATC